MIRAAQHPHRRVRLLRLEEGEPQLHELDELIELVAARDLLVLNDAGTLPASLQARTHGGEFVEIRLATQLDEDTWLAIALGEGSFRDDTNERPPPPTLSVGDALFVVGEKESRSGLFAWVLECRSSDRRLFVLRFNLAGLELTNALFKWGQRIQYSYHRSRLPPSWLSTPYAGRPWSVEMPSAGRHLSAALLHRLRTKGSALAWLTHAAGPSATGSSDLDRKLPFDERYHIPQSTIDAIEGCRVRGGRIIAVGTTVMRALEGCVAERGHLYAGHGRTALRVGALHQRRLVDDILCGIHGPGESHFELLLSFADELSLRRAYELADARGLQNHELGDLMLVRSGKRPYQAGV